jgi:phosphate transport system substrate-binding protein
MYPFAQARLLVLFFLLCSSYSFATSNPLFSIHGSNTLGAELNAKLLMGWFNERHASQVQRINTLENEYRIRAYDGLKQQWQEVRVSAHGSSTGFTHLIEKTGDIAASSRPIKSAEKKELSVQAPISTAEFEQVVAIDGLAIIVHPSNPLKKISLAQLKAIFSGEITHWEDIQAGVGAIHLYARDEHSGTWDSFNSMILNNRPLAAAQRFESNSALALAVSQDAGAIGFVGMGAIGENKTLALYEGQAQALPPNPLTVATEDYLLSRRLFMYSVSTKPAVKEFLHFVQSPAGQKIVAESGYISQQITAVTPRIDPLLPNPFKNLTQNAQRLTLNFRFIEGKVELDNKGNRDLQRLVAYLQQHPQMHLLLLGFADPKSSDENSKLLSKLRTRLVYSKLMRLGVHHAEVVGLGDEVLIAAAEELAGKIKNRRVEVWVRP